MTFLLDHDVPIEVAHVLRREGYAVHRLVEVMPIDVTDANLFERAYQEGWVTVTCNRQDFLQLAKAGDHAGLVILIRRATRQAECACILRLLRDAGSSGCTHNINFA